MIKLNTILNEEHNFNAISKILSEQNAIKILSKYYDINELDNQNYCSFYKGIDKNDVNEDSIMYFTKEMPKFILVNTPKLERTSANTGNYYTTLFSEILPSWRKYPKRNKSIIGSTFVKTASQFGTVYKVFPLTQSPKIGVCPDIDLWISFETVDIDSLSDFNDILEALLFKITHKYYVNTIELTNILKTTRVSNIPREFIEYLKKRYYIGDFFKNYISSGGNVSLYTYLNRKLDPQVNGFNLSNNVNELSNYYDRELWTDSKCILMRI